MEVGKLMQKLLKLLMKRILHLSNQSRGKSTTQHKELERLKFYKCHLIPEKQSAISIYSRNYANMIVNKIFFTSIMISVVKLISIR